MNNFKYIILNLNFFIYIIKLCFIVLFSIYTSLKLVNQNKFTLFNQLTFILIYIVISIFCGVIKYSIGFSLSIVILFILVSFIFAISTKNSIGYSMIIVIISLSINYILSFISLLASFTILRAIKIQNDLVSLLFIILFHFLFIYFFFKKRRFKNGLAFLQPVNKSEYLDLLILNICVTLMFSFILITNYDKTFIVTLFITITVLSIIMFITIQKTLTLYYKQKLMKQQIEETNKELENKDKIIEKLQAENINFSKISHSIAHRQKSLEYKLDKLISSKDSDTNLSSTENLKSEINKISEDYLSSINNIKTIPDLQKTGIPKIDDMLSYMQSECFKNKINFILNIKGNIYCMTNHFISVDKLEILLADFIKNSIIAITCSKNINRTILLVLGYVNSSYELCISDTGIEFEIDTLRNLGCTATTTHKDTGGTGYGFMNTFDTLREFKASLVIEEIGLPNISNYTKSIKVIFDNKNEFIIRSYRYNEMKNLQFNSKAILEEL